MHGIRLLRSLPSLRNGASATLDSPGASREHEPARESFRITPSTPTALAAIILRICLFIPVGRPRRAGRSRAIFRPGITIWRNSNPMIT